MTNCQHMAEQHSKDALSERMPSELCKEILCESFGNTRTYGASTAVITHLDVQKNKLGMAILGDSGVMVVRRPTHKAFAGNQSVRSTRNFVAFKSPSQQHEFNYPYQLCRLPQE